MHRLHACGVDMYKNMMQKTETKLIHLISESEHSEKKLISFTVDKKQSASVNKQPNYSVTVSKDQNRKSSHWRSWSQELAENHE